MGKKRKGGGFASALCRILGALILVSAFALLIPISVPRLFGYGVYEVVSGSMEPEIPVGSLLLVEPAEPADIEEGEIIAYGDGGSVITHRVEQNRKVEGEFVTKGDANETEDMEPVPYDSLIGRVKLHIPAAGTYMSLLSGKTGKLYMAIYIICGVLFFELAWSLGRKGRNGDGGTKQKK